jgi:hypothetical protein
MQVVNDKDPKYHHIRSGYVIYFVIFIDIEVFNSKSIFELLEGYKLFSFVSLIYRGNTQERLSMKVLLYFERWLIGKHLDCSCFFTIIYHDNIYNILGKNFLDIITPFINQAKKGCQIQIL